ncbi:MAG: hypothetical protein V3U87_09340 [Methylococcaceae bacterium]
MTENESLTRDMLDEEDLVALEVVAKKAMYSNLDIMEHSYTKMIKYMVLEGWLKTVATFGTSFIKDLLTGIVKIPDNSIKQAPFLFKLKKILKKYKKRYIDWSTFPWYVEELSTFKKKIKRYEDKLPGPIDMIVLLPNDFEQLNFRSLIS